MLARSVDCKWLGGNTTSASGSSVAFHLTIHQYPARCARPDVQTLAHAGSIPKSSRQSTTVDQQNRPKDLLRAALRGHHIASCKQAVNTKDYRTAAYEMKLEGRKEAAKSPQWLACCSLAIPAALLCSVVAPIVFSPILSHKAGATQVRLHDSVEIAACLDRSSVFTILCLTGC